METWLDLNTVNLLGRVDSRIDKDHLIRTIAQAYRLGKVISYRQIHEGIEDYNLKLNTKLGTYLVKIFSQFKSFRQVKDNVHGLSIFKDAGVRVPELYKTKRGTYVYYYESKKVSALACVMEYFSGKSFLKLKREPTLAEMKNFIPDIAKIHSTQFKPQGVYDVWVAYHLCAEYEKKSVFLTNENNKLIKKSLTFMKQFDLSKCTKGTIHGDLHRTNILTNHRGDLRIIDFSVMEYNAIVVDLAVFIALFSINPHIQSPKQAAFIYQEVIQEYLKYGALNAYDKSIMLDLMRATYAINHLAGSYELRGKGSDSEETRYWVDIGSAGMKLMDEIMN